VHVHLKAHDDVYLSEWNAKHTPASASTQSLDLVDQLRHQSTGVNIIRFKDYDVVCMRC
jgi:hypothetical protein